MDANEVIHCNHINIIDHYKPRQHHIQGKQTRNGSFHQIAWGVYNIWDRVCLFLEQWLLRPHFVVAKRVSQKHSRASALHRKCRLTWPSERLNLLVWTWALFYTVLNFFSLPLAPFLLLINHQLPTLRYYTVCPTSFFFQFDLECWLSHCSPIHNVTPIIFYSTAHCAVSP